MVGFTFSAKQIKAAPPEVRRWMETEIVKALTSDPAAAGEMPSRDSAERLQTALAAGTSTEMQETFQRVSSNSIISRVFFELARDTRFSGNATPFHVVTLVDVMRHLHLVEAQQVLTCLDAINQAFQQVRRDPHASLFALDEAGHIYLHDLTYHGIRQVWQQLVMAHPWPGSGHAAKAPAESAVSPIPTPLRQEPKLEAAMGPEPTFAGTAKD
ncbi:MAG TPA: hypothetical protein VIJ06_04320 [Methylovirgula sp.]